MTKEKVEEQVAVSKVVEADEKVKAIKAAKAAKKAEKHAARIEKHPKLGKAINWVDDNKLGVGVGVLLGGPLGVGAVLGYQKLAAKSYQKLKAKNEVEAIDSSESEELPFEE